MIHHFDPPQSLPPEHRHDFQWPAALGAGLIPGLILLIVPRGSPWSALTFFTPVVMGRTVPPQTGMSLGSSMLLHLAIAIVYGLIISRVVARVTQLRAVVAGGITGLILYLINFGVVSWSVPEFRGNEVLVVFTHAVFGLIAGGAYRGLLRRVPTSDATNR